MIGVISRNESDITKVLKSNHVPFEILDVDFNSLAQYEQLMILGGTDDQPLTFNLRQYRIIEDFIKTGKKVFVEYVASFGAFLTDGTKRTSFERIAFVEQGCDTLSHFDLVDTQQALRTIPFDEVELEAKVKAVFTQEHAHSRLKKDQLKYCIKDYALFELNDNVLISTVQLANYHQGAYAPIQKANGLIDYVFEWLNIGTAIQHFEPLVKFFNESDKNKVIDHILTWFKENDLLINKGRDGVYEGFGSEIYPNGERRFADVIRGDCSGEVSLFYCLAGLYFDDSSYIETAENLVDACLNDFTIHDGKCQGFVRWSSVALESTYGDDVARMIIPILLKNLLYQENLDELKTLEMICDFHVKTTGYDGQRQARFELSKLNETDFKDLQEKECQCPSAHYNAYLSASFLLAYLLFDKESYYHLGLQGLDSLMKIYPNTRREQSQTQELARLLMPLSIAYLVSQDQLYLNYMNQVYQDLLKYKHESGCFLEWDEGYKAVMRHTKGDGECSLLAENGDSVVDLLYTNNWLPMAFSLAYIASDDERYFNEAKSIVHFLESIQMKSDDQRLNGVWCRAFDPEIFEYYGSPADKGWGPYSIETGWTVAEIGAGILFLENIDEFKKKLWRAK
ncbi:hypothetical protein ERUR111494_00470 [Erysipelothrix urinaevulpis]|uniref:hypothetical protein n=1 Tax=Erysipelothrix urinaevulpis TaxID=2683717 RepID=UPI00135C86DC|nr:hypothetical protein [Erysipelothrix urinaevulpis]